MCHLLILLRRGSLYRRCVAHIRYLEHALAARDRLTDAERAALAALPSRRETYADGERIIAAGLAPDESCLLVSGMAMRAHRIGRANRVVSALHVPGDFVDLHAFVLEHLDHDVVALGGCTVEFVPAAALRRLTEAYPHLTRLLWLVTLVDAKMHRVWVAARTALPAARRVGHLLCEMQLRLAAVELTEGTRFSVAFDQRRLAEILGYSVVHVNRAVQELRTDGLVIWEGHEIELPDLDRIRADCSFDPAYLELHRQSR